MHQRSTFSAPSSAASRTQRGLSPINAAQRAGYNLDALAPAQPAQPAAHTSATKAAPSTASQSH